MRCNSRKDSCKLGWLRASKGPVGRSRCLALARPSSGGWHFVIFRAVVANGSTGSEFAERNRSTGRPRRATKCVTTKDEISERIQRREPWSEGWTIQQFWNMSAVWVPQHNTAHIARSSGWHYRSLMYVPSAEHQLTNLFRRFCLSFDDQTSPRFAFMFTSSFWTRTNNECHPPSKVQRITKTIE